MFVYYHKTLKLVIAPKGLAFGAFERLKMKIDRTNENISKYKEAIDQINHERDNYDPSNFKSIGKIASSIVLISEFVKTNNFDTKTEGAKKQKEYFRTVYKDDYCLVLSKENKFQAFSRNKVMKYLRGEGFAHGNLKPADDDKTLLQSYLYETDKQIQVDFAIRRDFIDTPFIRCSYESTDSNYLYSEVTKNTVNGTEHEFTTIESVVFSICNEVGFLGSDCKMSWDKTMITDDNWRRNIDKYFPKHIGVNIKKQIHRWDKWNKQNY